ncbi:MULTISPECIES: DUF4843 domain-containing protein [Butyricimonas]|uniref:DUF4843 domain-containing protein n=1 Tax=Butyricimonas TaxID=574697 RepID=UPI0009F221A2|nr:MULTISPECIES: DUF4843 domain-containing protein [Butyricimonas]
MKTSILLNRFFRLCCTMLVISAFLGGCDRDYLWYDTDQKAGVYFLGSYDTLDIRPSSLGNEWCEYSDRIDVLGFSANVDRHFKVELVDSLSTIPAERLRFEDTCYIPAGQTFGMLNFSYAYSETDTVSVVFKLVENEHFQPVISSQVCYIIYPFKLYQPMWWSWSGYMFGTAWSPKYNELVLRFYHQVEELEPYVWTEYFLPNLGKNIEKIWNYDFAEMQGWFRYFWKEPYNTMLKRYVARPLYDHLKAHPEDGDYTLMPDPYL